jgi:hypothetical protein
MSAYQLKLHSAVIVCVTTNVPQTIPDSFVMPITLSNRMEQVNSHWTDFRETLYREGGLPKICGKIQFGLNSDRCNFITLN